MQSIRYLLGVGPKFDWKATGVTVVSTLLLIADAYHRFTASKSLDRLILYGAVPLIIILVIFRENPRDYGLGLGEWKAGVLLTVVAAVIVAPVLWLTAHTAAMKEYYAPQLAGLPWNTLFELIGWEFFFRGFILFAYVRRFGPDAIWLQAVPFALAHVGKPEVEVISTIFGGFAFGWLAYRTRSFVYPLLLHWFVASFTVLVAAGAVG